MIVVPGYDSFCSLVGCSQDTYQVGGLNEVGSTPTNGVVQLTLQSSLN